MFLVLPCLMVSKTLKDQIGVKPTFAVINASICVPIRQPREPIPVLVSTLETV